MTTALSRRSPLLDLNEFRGVLNPLFSDLEAQMGVSQRWEPAIDVVRHDGEVVVRADVPGVPADDIKIEVEDDTLTISGEHEDKVTKKEGRYMRRERRYGAFTRSIALPPETDPDSIDAKVKDGVVEVTIPLPDKAARQKKVQIEAKPG